MDVQQLDPSKFHILTPKKKLVLIISLLIFVFVVLPPLSLWYYNAALNRPSQTSKEVTFEIKNGQFVSDIADNLYEAGAINSKFLFNFYAKSTKLDRNIQAGLYTIKAGTSIKQLVEQLQHGTLDNNVTFIEGWRVEEFARKAALEFPNVNYSEFIKLAKDDEGRLFPDTYIFNSSVTTQEVLDHLRDTFNNKTKDLLSSAYLEKSGLTPQEALVFASLVEREASNSNDKPIIAGILIKRWKEGMKLDVDATTQYVVANKDNPCNTQTLACESSIDFSKISWWKKDLTLSDLNLDNPYNTRKVIGLPPSPISSVSLDSLKAVVNYINSDYYFYINDTEGNTHFAITLKEHEDNVAKYLNNN